MKVRGLADIFAQSPAVAAFGKWPGFVLMMDGGACRLGVGCVHASDRNLFG